LDASIKEVVDSAWGVAFGVEPSLFAEGGVLIVLAEDGIDQLESVLVDQTCVVCVPARFLDTAHQVFDGLAATEAFSHEPLDRLVDDAGTILGRSWHHYGDEHSLRALPHPAAEEVAGGNLELQQFLEVNSIEEWAESGFPRIPAIADPDTTKFWIYREQGQVVAAGNMTEWRGLPADVGVLVSPVARGRGVASRLAGAMINDGLPAVGVVRYRALSTNAASLRVAERLGFVRYGGNYLARTG